MTLLAAIVRGEETWMLADSHAYGQGRLYPNVTKIIRRKVVYDDHTQAGDVLIAAAGVASMQHIARNVEIPQPKKAAAPIAFADALSVALQAHSAELASSQVGEDQIWLVAWQGTIWTFVNYDVGPHSDSCFEAAGAGAEICLGALETMARNDLIWANPAKALTDAADISAQWCYYVKGPYQLEHLVA